MNSLVLNVSELDRLSRFSEHAVSMLSANPGLSTVIEDVGMESGPFIAIRPKGEANAFLVLRIDSRMPGLQLVNSLQVTNAEG